MTALPPWHEHLATIRRGAEEWLATVPTEALYRRPGPGRWSAADCLAHLVQSRAAYSRHIDAALAAARPVATNPEAPIRLSYLERWFIRSMEPPVRRTRLRAPRVFEGRVIADRAAMLRAYFDSLDAFERLIRATDGRDLDSLRISSPANRLLRLSVAAAFALLLAHERRHLWQAQNATGSFD
jgi:hypothetical protein